MTRSLALGRFLSGPTLLVALFATSEARARDAAQCTSQFETGQALALEGKLSAARADFAKCTANACPSLIREECSKRFAAIGARVSSVVFAAHAVGGGDLIDVAVDVDATRVLTSLTGKAIEIDPGPHRIRFTVEAKVVDEFDLVVREGEKLRPLVRQIGRAGEGAPPAKVEPPPPRPVPWTVYATGGVAVAGLGVFAFFGARGVSEYGRLDDACAPICSHAEQQSVRTQLLAADIALGVAVLASAAALWLYLDRPPTKRSTATLTTSGFRF